MNEFQFQLNNKKNFKDKKETRKTIGLKSLRLNCLDITQVI